MGERLWDRQAGDVAMGQERTLDPSGFVGLPPPCPKPSLCPNARRGDTPPKLAANQKPRGSDVSSHQADTPRCASRSGLVPRPGRVRSPPGSAGRG